MRCAFRELPNSYVNAHLPRDVRRVRHGFGWKIRRTLEIFLYGTSDAVSAPRTPAGSVRSSCAAALSPVVSSELVAQAQRTGMTVVGVRE